MRFFISRLTYPPSPFGRKKSIVFRLLGISMFPI